MVHTLERAPETGFADLVIGVNYGDEGKGNTVDRLLRSGEYSVAARFNGGANAGHQLFFKGQEIALHQVPSGIAHDNILNVIGNGSYVDPEELVKEIAEIVDLGLSVSPNNLLISDTAHLVLPHQKTEDRLREVGRTKQGSTAKGIAFVGGDKYRREGARPELFEYDIDKLHQLVIDGLTRTNLLLREAKLTEEQMTKHDLHPVNPKERFEAWLATARAIQPHFTDTFPIVHEYLDSGRNILAEGAQATGLDIEHGIYPLNTSSHATPGGAMNGLGIAHHHIRHVFGVSKLTMSRVGGESGPFVTRVSSQLIAKKLRGNKEDVDGEYGKSTGRERDMGYPDNTLIKRAKRLGVTQLVLTKLDLVPRFGKKVKVAIAYEFEGQRLEVAPNSASKLAACRAIYETFPTWQEDISQIRDYAELPVEARNLVEFIEQDTELPVVGIGVGPDREQVIFKRSATGAEQSPKLKHPLAV